MPRINDDLLRAAVFMYPSVDDAERRTSFGGSGFIIGFEVHGEDGGHAAMFYVVTNAHIVNGGHRVAAITERGNKTHIVPLDLWTTHPDGDDVAVAPIKWIAADMAVETAMFMTLEAFDKNAFGPGDDVTMIGRFVGLDDQQRNSATARFGHLAMGQVEKLENPWTGLKQESFLVEMRSLPGYSGSAVYVHTGSLVISGIPNERRLNQQLLLGIDWGHVQRYTPVLEPIEGTEPTTYQQVEKWVVQENSGMAAVVPAWKIRELLEEESVKKHREAAEKQWRLEHQVKRGGVSPDAAPTPFTKQDMETALKKVSRRKPSQPDEGTSGTSE